MNITANDYAIARQYPRLTEESAKRRSLVYQGQNVTFRQLSALTGYTYSQLYKEIVRYDNTVEQALINLGERK